MEKFTPTYKLEEFKQSRFEITRTANRNAQELGFYEKDIYEVVSTMKDE